MSLGYHQPMASIQLTQMPSAMSPIPESNTLNTVLLPSLAIQPALISPLLRLDSPTLASPPPSTDSKHTLHVLLFFFNHLLFDLVCCLFSMKLNETTPQSEKRRVKSVCVKEIYILEKGQIMSQLEL